MQKVLPFGLSLCLLLATLACGLWPTPAPRPTATAVPTSTFTPTPTAPPTPTPPPPTPTPLPTLTPLPTPTDTPAPPTVSARPTTNANVRAGPGVEYHELGVLLPDMTVEAVGRNAASTWLHIPYPPSADGYGWVSASVLEVQGDVTSLPVVEAGKGE